MNFKVDVLNCLAGDVHIGVGEAFEIPTIRTEKSLAVIGIALPVVLNSLSIHSRVHVGVFLLGREGKMEVFQTFRVRIILQTPQTEGGLPTLSIEEGLQIGEVVRIHV